MTTEKRLATVEASIKVIAEYVKQQTSKIEKEIEAVRSDAAAAKPETLEAHDYHKEIEELREHINSIRTLRSDFDDFKMDVLPKVRFIERRTDNLKEIVDNSIGSSDLTDIKRRMDKIDNSVHRVLAIEKELDDMEGTLTKIKGMANRLKDLDAGSYKEEFDRRMRQMLEQISNFDSTDFKAISANLKHLKSLNADDIEELTKRTNETVAAMEDESVNRIAVEKRVADLEERMEKMFDEEKRTDTEEMKQVRETIEKFQAGDAHQTKALAEQMTEMKSIIEDELVNRISIDKRIHDIEDSLTGLNNSVKSIGGMESTDIEKIYQRINDMEGNIKMDSIRMLTQQLNDFAKSVDRRLPNVVSKEEHVRQIADINQRMRTIEAPDLSPLAGRVERLERKIEEVASMMRSVYNRMPIVVE